MTYEMFTGALQLPIQLLRKMARNKMEAPPVSYDSDSDEAPEVVTKQSAEEQVQLQQQKEVEASKAATAAKRKRKSKKDEEVAQLPEDVLSAVAARDEEEEEAEEVAQQEEERAVERRAKKQAKLLQQKTHTRHFGNLQVQTLQALEQAQARDLTDSAKEFVDRRFAPTRARMDLLKGHPSQFTKKQKRRV